MNKPPNHYNAALGKAIETRRKALDLTQEQVAHQANLRIGYIARSEQGKTEFHLHRLRAIAAALGTTPQDLLDDADERA
jgi:transcriptional regulator with XRE-family HTH domain